MVRAPVVASPRIDWEQLPDAVRSAVEAALGARVVAASTQRGGFSPGTAARVRLADGRRAFVKAVGVALNPETPDLHRREAQALQLIPRPAPAPRLLHLHDDGDWVALVLEDIEGRTPALPWPAEDAAAVADVVASVSRVPAPAGLPAFGSQTRLLESWDEIAADHTGIDPALLDRLPEMRQHQSLAREVTRGDRLVHWDARADNVLLRPDGGAVLVDWAWACHGAPWLDLLALALDFRIQGGPDPDDFLADHPVTRSVPPAHLAALVASLVGMWAERARQPVPRGLPTIREWQAHCARGALRWLDRGRLWG